MNVLLISTYELGRQPFGLASPAAWLRRAGASVKCLDLSRQPLQEDWVRSAGFIAFYVPMHTATRLAVQVLPTVRKFNPGASLCFYGLYAPVNEGFLRKLGAETILGGEFEPGLVRAFERVRDSKRQRTEEANRTSQPDEVQEETYTSQPDALVSVAKQTFLVPDRTGLPPLSRYARLTLSDGRHLAAGYTEASRGCKHLCRHCPVVPVYGGLFRVVQRDVVLEDIRRQVSAGAEHITFGDPDFFNGIRHAVELVRALHAEHPLLTYDVTIKIEHLLRHAEHIRTLRDTGCLFVTSAVESVDDSILERLEKGHTYADFVGVVKLFREVGLVLSPTFVAFTPWTSLEGYCDLLACIADLGLIEQVAPIQLAIRLLIPAGSHLLDLPEVRKAVSPFDEAALVFPWTHREARVDELALKVQEVVEKDAKKGETRQQTFAQVWTLAHKVAEMAVPVLHEPKNLLARAAVPYLTEPWYC